jgi:hypothetical protein
MENADFQRKECIYQGNIVNFEHLPIYSETVFIKVILSICEHLPIYSETVFIKVINVNLWTPTNLQWNSVYPGNKC